MMLNTMRSFAKIVDEERAKIHKLRLQNMQLREGQAKVHREVIVL